MQNFRARRENLRKTNINLTPLDPFLKCYLIGNFLLIPKEMYFIDHPVYHAAASGRGLHRGWEPGAQPCLERSCGCHRGSVLAPF